MRRILAACVVVPVLQRLGFDAQDARAKAQDAIGKLPKLSGNTIPESEESNAATEQNIHKKHDNDAIK